LFYFTDCLDYFIFSDKDADEILNWEEYSSIPSDNMIVRYTDTTRKDEVFIMLFDWCFRYLTEFFPSSNISLNTSWIKTKMGNWISGKFW